MTLQRCAMETSRKPCATLSQSKHTSLFFFMMWSFIVLTRHISSYLNRPSVRDALGVDPSIGNYTMSSDDVNRAFTSSLDHYHTTYHHVAALLERDVRVLIYVGANDYACNYIGNEKWTLNLEWTGKEEFVRQDLREWKVDGKVAGKTRKAKGFTFATIDGAGHMVRMQSPVYIMCLILLHTGTI